MERSSFKHFNLREEPFAPTSNPEYFYFAKEYRECLFRLKQSIDLRHGIAIIFGDYGTGKTSLLRTLLADMAAQKGLYNNAIVSSPNPSWSGYGLLEAIVKEFKIEPSRRSLIGLGEDLNRYVFQNRHRINNLIIDDAQNLNKTEHVELLRLIQNLETPQHKLLNLVLFAQLEWLPLIRSKPSFEQRVNTAFVFKPLNFEETRDLIFFRLRKAGLPETETIFEEGSIEAIYEFSKGIPRRTVQVCRNAFIIAERIKARKVDRKIVLYTIKNTTVAGIDIDVPGRRSNTQLAARG